MPTKSPNLKGRSVFAVNGIHNDPANPDAWTDNAARILASWGADEQKHEYGQWWVNRWWMSESKYQYCARAFWHAVENTVDVIAHSLGTHMTLQGIDRCQSRKTFHTVMLIQGATHADCKANLANKLMAQGRIERLVVTCSANDAALNVARWANWPPGKRVLGQRWGPIGLLPELKGRVLVLRDDTRGHDGWTDKEHLPDTLRRYARIALMSDHEFSSTCKAAWELSEKGNGHAH